MTLFQAIILGAVQGITEFFPISSSGHLVLFQSFFGLKEPQLAFDIFLHLGTILSVLIYFRRDIIRLFTTDKKMMFLIIAASVPTFLIGFTFKDLVERFFVMPKLVSCMLGITGAYLILASMRSRQQKATKGLDLPRSLIIGIAQGVAIVPGISRSGATIATGIFSGLDGELAVKFSFLLSVPAVLGASVLKMRDISHGITGQESASFLAGGFIAMLAGLAAIRILLGLVRNKRLDIFGLYCILVALLGIILA